MASPIVYTDLLNGVGEFPPITEHTFKSLLQKSDRDKAPANGFTNWNTAAWARTVNDTRDMDGIDITDFTQFSDEVQEVLKAATCFMIMHLMWKRSRSHKDDVRNFEAKDALDNYERIRGRLVLYMPHGRLTQAGAGCRLVRES